MAFVEDLDLFFDESDFAVAAVFTRSNVLLATVKGNFDLPTADRGYDQTMVAEDAPAFLCKTTDLATIRRGDAVTINAQAYKVELLQAEDDGAVTRVMLSLF
jgi:hypothetical protein